MTWFKVDDKFWSHPKTAGLSDAATALWVRAGSWSAGHLTDGFVPDSALRFFRARRRAADELVTAGLWSAAEGGFKFHDWAEYQPSKTQVTARREATKNRVNAWREGKGNGVTETSQGPTRNAAPVPTRPVPLIQEIPPDPFDEFWEHYPRKVAKGQARSAFRLALKKTTLPVMLEALSRYKPDPGFVAHPATWLNGERWTDQTEQADPYAGRRVIGGPRSA